MLIDLGELHFRKLPNFSHSNYHFTPYNVWQSSWFDILYSMPGQTSVQNEFLHLLYNVLYIVNGWFNDIFEWSVTFFSYKIKVLQFFFFWFDSKILTKPKHFLQSIAITFFFIYDLGLVKRQRKDLSVLESSQAATCLPHTAEASPCTFNCWTSSKEAVITNFYSVWFDPTGTGTRVYRFSSRCSIYSNIDR